MEDMGSGEENQHRDSSCFGPWMLVKWPSTRGVAGKFSKNQTPQGSRFEALEHILQIMRTRIMCMGRVQNLSNKAYANYLAEMEAKNKAALVLLDVMVEDTADVQFIYASPLENARNRAWDELRVFSQSVSGPWCAVKFHSKGTLFTWQRGFVMEKCDRVVGNDDWHSQFSEGIVTNIPLPTSYHCGAISHDILLRNLFFINEERMGDVGSTTSFPQLDLARLNALRLDLTEFMPYFINLNGIYLECIIHLIQSLWLQPCKIREINATVITLIPKVLGLEFPSQFQSILQRNVSYKILIKLLSSRLCDVLSDSIGPSQCAVNKGRQALWVRVFQIKYLCGPLVLLIMEFKGKDSKLMYEHMMGFLHESNACLKSIWSWKGQPRIRVFLWKLFHGRLPTLEELTRRGSNRYLLFPVVTWLLWMDSNAFSFNNGTCSPSVIVEKVMFYFHVELWGILDGICLAKALNIPKLLVEADSKVTLQLVKNGYPQLHSCSSIVKEINDGWVVMFFHIYREAIETKLVGQNRIVKAEVEDDDDERVEMLKLKQWLWVVATPNASDCVDGSKFVW
ncbi:hypothetical protein RJT34_04125 [Clitoria ternatea]|uniref:RNase H type-1 domain-containing protein n=1 Tax=Clitoria ternatea TaxID=43366 RepID=A0AAN9KP62_CLITE